MEQIRELGVIFSKQSLEMTNSDYLVCLNHGHFVTKYEMTNDEYFNSVHWPKDRLRLSLEAQCHEPGIKVILLSQERGGLIRKFKLIEID